MRGFLATLCVLSLIYTNATATGLRGLGWSKRPIEMLRGFGGDKLADLSSKAKQLGAGLLLAGIVTCSAMPCVADEITHILPETEVTNLIYTDSINLYQVTAELKQIEGAQIDIIEIADQNLLTVEIDNGTVHLQLSENEIPTSESPIEGWLEIALAVGTGTLVFVTLTALISKDIWPSYGVALAMVTLLSGMTSAGTYYILLHL